MKNPWLDIPLDDYESHMALPQVGQSQLLSRVLREAIESYKPSSVALLGCAGGNGLEQVASTSVERVVGIDINQQYLERAAARYKDQVARLEFFAGDLGVDRFVFAPVDLVFAGLIFEYVDTAKLLDQALSMLAAGGRLISVVQLPSPIEDVTPSPYTSLKRLSSTLRVVSPKQLMVLAREAGFDTETERLVTASGGKGFHVSVLRAER
jgi:trans-aconitate methyltransferase